MNQTIEWKKSQAGSTEAVQFTDGMLVTAEDLGAAMRYPLSVVQVLLRAYFGCGIVCGLNIRAAAPPQPGQKDAADNAVGSRPPECDADYGLIVEKGVALGCDGYPIELCGPLKLDLTPDPCRVDRDSKPMFIAIRRVTAAEAAARPCGCGSSADPSAQQCTRMRDHVLVQAFDQEHLPKDLCRAADPKTGAGTSTAAAAPPEGGASPACDCLTQCGDCACCGEPWVLLGSVTVGEQGLSAITREGSRYVKPVACLCGAPGQARAAWDPAPKVAAQMQAMTEAPLKPTIGAPTLPEMKMTPMPEGQAGPDTAATPGTEAPASGTAASPAAETQPAANPPAKPAGGARAGTKP